MQAFALVSERLPGVRLVITGEPSAGMQSSRVEEALRKLPGTQRAEVRTVGHLPGSELRALVQGACVLTYPSKAEGFGLPPLEAMAAGVPVVASNAPAVAEATGGAALLADPNSPEQWALALEAILSNPEKASQLRAAGLQRSRLFTWERCAKEALEVYRRVAGATL